MDRLELTTEALTFVSDKRASHAAAAATEDLDLSAQDRRDREHVMGPNCRIKRDDDVAYNGFPVRVIGPARGEGYFYALLEAPWGFTDVPLDGASVSDRAPADTNEEPLPIWTGDPPASRAAP